ncbi:putative glycosyltransferase [Kineococcus radiotolerans]|uniref:Putative glycosyltransferase n=1 Tax=Kineococcus radiotolerans TaxID=131568 RepID=A0A7W4TQ47_KINRA|nr:glycosyltransferase [Kineococcus radiotolerans]MBB2903051.1 putative glycosyltransferase [Kineococcus radiotolerans]
MPTPTPARRPRVALYGHDTCGLGHLRRNLALAAALRAADARPDVLILTGSPAAQRFPRPDGVEIVVLPTVSKDADGRYAAGSLDVPLDVVVQLRAATAEAVLTAWQPDLLVVDKVPTGFRGELAGALDALRRNGSTRTVLGLRDVLDSPATARAEWSRDDGPAALDRWYDEVWVYGDARVHDLRHDLRLTRDQRLATRFTGYLAEGRRTTGTRPLPRRCPSARTVLAGVGGGVDGADLTRALLATPLPPGTELVLLPGPFADAGLHAELDRAAATRTDLHVVPFTDGFPDWAQAADAVVCMGGYNTVAEVLATDTPALVVPRTRPRREQLVRARSMARRGLLDVLTSPTPQALGRWVEHVLAEPTSQAGARTRCDLAGLDAVRRRAGELLGAAPAALHLPAPLNGTESRRAS